MLFLSDSSESENGFCKRILVKSMEVRYLVCESCFVDVVMFWCYFDLMCYMRENVDWLGVFREWWGKLIGKELIICFKMKNLLDCVKFKMRIDNE